MAKWQCLNLNLLLKETTSGHSTKVKSFFIANNCKDSREAKSELSFLLFPGHILGVAFSFRPETTENVQALACNSQGTKNGVLPDLLNAAVCGHIVS